MRVPEFALVAVGLGVIALGCRGGQDAQPAGGDATGLISAETQAAVPIVTTDAELVASLERVVEQLVGTDEFSGVVLLSRHGQSLVRRAYGLADRERQRANTVHTPFALASVSKMFTAVVVAQLVEKGLISVDATIGSLLPAYPSGEVRSKVTVHHLLTMSSGIADLFRSPQFWADAARISTSAELWPYFAYAPLEFEPGTKGSYSNSNFLVLGAITERLVGRPFIEIVEERIFRPVGMTSTGYRSRAFPNAAVGYTRRPSGSGTGTSGDSDQWHRAWDDFSPPEGLKAGDNSGDCVPCTPMGGGYSTADDLARFAGAVMEGRLLSPDMTRRVLTGYVPANEYPGHEGYGLRCDSWAAFELPDTGAGSAESPIVSSSIRILAMCSLYLRILTPMVPRRLQVTCANWWRLLPCCPSVGNDLRPNPPLHPTAAAAMMSGRG